MISNATTAVDSFTQTVDADTLNVTESAQVNAGDVFDGAAGTDTIVVTMPTTNHADFRTATVSNYESLHVLNTTGINSVSFSATQFGVAPGLLSNTLQITGAVGGVQDIHIYDAHNFQTQFVLTNWTAGTDWLAYHGTAGADTFLGSATADKFYGGAGNDTYYVNESRDSVIESAASGTDTVYSSVSHTLAAEVEKLILTGTAALNGTGNALDNDLTGNAAINILDGGAGNDTMTGGAGNDLYVVNSAGDTIVELTNGGTDTVRSSVDYSIAGLNVENIVLTTGDTTATANAFANRISGSAGNNTIFGDAGNDTIDGGAGADTMDGGAGNDTYTVDNTSDVVTEALNGGNDAVISSATFTIGAEVEILVLSGTANINGTGNAIRNQINGNTGANVLVGGGGNDIINGFAGADTMEGGADSDTYYVDNALDQVTELLGEGTDHVLSTVTFTLGANVDHLTLQGAAAINGTGNAMSNRIIGNGASNYLIGDAGNDTLDGGVGSDTMEGGAGSDTYFVNVATDVITEAAAAGTDTVNSAVTMTLATNFENLTLTGAAAINATGNAVANVLTGNTGANVLDGGAGDDTLTGGAGNDTYIIDSATETIVELANGGTDTVQSAFTYSIAGTALEHITLTAGNTTATGNEVANKLTGSTGNNLLVGDAGNDTLDGGAGTDTMEGGLGNDYYIVDSSSDVTTELLNGGTDTVQSSQTITLAANVENALLTGSTAINVTGNALANTLTGNTGANALTGGAGNDTLNGGTGADAMDGGADSDYYTVDNVGDTVTEALNEGVDHVTSTVSFTLGANVDNLTLSGAAALSGTGNDLDNTIIGSTANNTLTGNAGNDSLNGGTGADTMSGGAGNDSYNVDNVGDQVTEALNEGTDLITSTISIAALAANVENLTLSGATALSGTGNTLDNMIIGSTVNNTLYGDAGNDTLDGGAGNDTMEGGAGNDTYVINVVTDVVTEAASSGTDTVRAGVSATLAANVENLILVSGTAAVTGTGNTLDNVLTGTFAANTLTGLAGNDTLDGQGGADTMLGGAGDDTYLVDHTGDIVTELASEGADTITANVNYTLSLNVEDLVLVGFGNWTGTGNTAANDITGNIGANSLYGLDGNDTLDGATGADKLYGGDGDDTYYVDNIADQVFETNSVTNGIDVVYSTVNFTLSADVDDLYLGGTALTGTGNALINIMHGNALNNVLDGGIGADFMVGFTGNDTYVVDDSFDSVTEAVGEGTDTIRANFSYTLSGTQEVENLELTGTTSISGTGNALANLIKGNTAANSLNGGAGADSLQGGLGNDTLSSGTGADQLTGGDGADVFRFTSTSDSNTANGIDSILDFSGGAVQPLVPNSGDRIDVSTIDANSTVAGTQDFVLDANGTFVAGEYNIVTVGNAHTVNFYIDGVAGADMIINVTSTSPLAAGDFLF